MRSASLYRRPPVLSYASFNVQSWPILIGFVAGDDDGGNFSSLNHFTRIPGLDKGRVGTQPRPLLFVELVLEFVNFGAHTLNSIRQSWFITLHPLPW